MEDLTSARALAHDYSLEMTARDVAGLRAAAPFIRPGTRISIAFLPGEAMEDRIVAAQTVRELGFVPVPHLSARRLLSDLQLHDFLDALSRRAGVQDVFVVAGDPATSDGPYVDALDVILRAGLGDYGVRHVGIGGYPEGHPQIGDGALQTALLTKLEELDRQGLGSSITTQFGFDAPPVLKWLEAQRRLGVPATVRVGLPGPASIKTLLNFAARCGVRTSTSVMKKYGLSLTRLLGNAGPDVLFNELLQGLRSDIHGPVRLHFYPFGGLEKTARWIRARTGEADGLLAIAAANHA